MLPFRRSPGAARFVCECMLAYCECAVTCVLPFTRCVNVRRWDATPIGCGLAYLTCLVSVNALLRCVGG